MRAYRMGMSGRARRGAWGAGAVALCALLLAAALAGCGRTTTDSGASSPSPPGVKGTSVRPCTGGTADVSVEGTPALALTESTPGHAGSAHKGDLIQVQLASTEHWGLNTASANLAATQHAGDQDDTHHVCFWNFRAQAAGAAKLGFTGTALCESGSACPLYARDVQFTITIS